MTQPDESHNPWTTLASKELYSNPWIKVVENQILNPAGGKGIYGVVHYKNTAVGVVPYEDGHVWMVGQYRYPLNLYSWEIPEGGGLKEESPLEAAKRELLEETGLKAGHYSPLLEMHLSNSVSDEWGIVYLATNLQQGKAEPEDTEELHVRRMPLEEVFAEVEAGRITDSLTVAAIYKMMYLRVKGDI